LAQFVLTEVRIIIILALKESNTSFLCIMRNTNDYRQKHIGLTGVIIGSSVGLR